MFAISQIKSNAFLKKLALRLLMPKNDNRPRFWVRYFLNPFRHRRGKQTIIRSRTRLDVFPFNDFALGNKSTIEDFATINNAVGAVQIGEDTIIGIGCTIIGPVFIGDHVMLAQHVVASGLNHSYEDTSLPPKHQKETRKIIVISDNVWIGANSVITAGVTIGRHSVIGAGSVVTKDVPEYSVAVGNPAKVIKRYNTHSGAWERVGAYSN